jgi:ABC-2 type transport system permease protein
VISAILAAQLASLRNLHARTRRGGALLGAFGYLIWYGMWAFVALGAFALTAGAAPEQLESVLPRALLAIFAYWQLSPMVSASLGASLDLRKLLVYPIPQGRLFFVEILLRFTTSVEMLMVLAAGCAGLLANPTVAIALSRLAAAAGLFAVLNLLLSVGTRSLIERLLARRRVREILILALVSLIALPRLLIEFGFPFWRFAWLLEGSNDDWLPWGAPVALLSGSWLAAALMAAWCALAYVFGRGQFERSLRFDSAAARSGGSASSTPWTESFYSLAALLLPESLSALVEKELRALSRTPRFRTVFIMGFTFGMIVWLPLAAGRRSQPGFFAQNFLTLVSIYALVLLGQVSYLNAFGFDRAAAQLYYLAPVPVRRALAAKNIAAGIFIALEIGIVTAVSLFLVAMPPIKILESLLVTTVAALFLLGAGNLASVHFPKPMNPDRVGQGDPPRRQAFFILVFPLAMSPVLLAYAARRWFAADAAFYAVLGAVGAAGAFVYWMATTAAAAAAVEQRETVIAELSRGGGPMSIE